LRVTIDIGKLVNCLLEDRLGISRMAWISEAIREKKYKSTNLGDFL